MAPTIGQHVNVWWSWGGNHYGASGLVVKVNRKTLKVALDTDCSDHFVSGFVVTVPVDATINNGAEVIEEW